jgi:hypothetical protein
MLTLKDIFPLAKVKVWDGGCSYNTKDNTPDIQDAYMRQSQADVKPFYDGLDSTHRKILAQILSQVLHHDDFARFLSLTVLADAKTKLFQDSLDWVDEQTKNIHEEENRLKKENDELRNQLREEIQLKEDLDRQLHDINYRLKQIKELVS